MALSHPDIREEEIRTPKELARVLNRALAGIREVLSHGITDEHRKVAVKDVPLKTPATVSDAFPFAVSVPGYVGRPLEVRVVSVRDADDSEATVSTAPFVDWMKSGEGIVIRNITGLAVSTNYVIRLRIEGE